MMNEDEYRYRFTPDFLPLKGVRVAHSGKHILHNEPKIIRTILVRQNRIEAAIIRLNSEQDIDTRLIDYWLHEREKDNDT